MPKLLTIMVSLLVLGWLLYTFVIKQPLNEQDWLDNQARLPLVQRQQHTLHIEGLRDFRYNEDGTTAESRYRNEQYNTQGLSRVWFGLSHFADYGLAHAFLSFEFNDGRFLATSIEARMTHQQRFNPFAGLFNQYNRMMVIGTEADIIGLRTYYRHERTLLYPLQLSPSQQQELLHNLMDDATALQQQPAFYNTMLDNCITGIIQHGQQWQRFWSWFDYRILLPGHSDKLAWKLGLFAMPDGASHTTDTANTTVTSLKQLRQYATIDPAVAHPRNADFSLRIRQQWSR